MKKSSFVLAAVSAALLSVGAQAADSASLRSQRVSNLEFLRNVFQAQYAPAAWKKSFAQWDLNREIDLAEQAVSSSAEMSTREYQLTLKRFFDSTRDYHTSISFLSTEEATLPFVVQGANGRYFISYIDRAKLPSDSFPFNVGDELVRFGDRATADAVKDLIAVAVVNTAQTDEMQATLNLTRRRAARGFAVPRGPITIAVKPKGSDRVYTRQLIWDYTAERVPNPLFNALARVQMAPQPSFSLNRLMVGGDYEAGEISASDSNPYLLGARKTFTPDLGKKIWQSGEKDPFYAYIFQNADRRLIGYVRIPSYMAVDYAKDTAAALEHFRKIVSLFEGTTDALVIDQVNNPGGSVGYLYALASMLSDQTMTTPRHRMTITQADVMNALKVQDKLAKVTNDEEAKAVLTSDPYLSSELDGYPASYEIAQFWRSWAQFIVDEFRAGRTLTNPYFIEGVDHINPAPEHYSKPILLLTNSLDFSGGDFFPAIMQDNKRVTVMGTRTAGAGGYVLEFQYPNLFGVEKFRVTGSIAERADLNPIENLGVKPEIEYSITESDLQNNYADYVRAIQTAVSALVK